MLLPESKLTKHQKVTRSVEFVDGGRRYRLDAEIRHDDSDGNGHNSFAITADLYDCSAAKRAKTRGYVPELISSGCLHDEIAVRMPELAPLLKWHLTSTDGPMHYLANTIYFASDRDHNGRRKGEPTGYEHGITFDRNPIRHRPGGRDSNEFVSWLRARVDASGFGISMLKVESIRHRDHGKPGKHQFAPKYTFSGFGEYWHECPFDSEREARAFRTALIECSPEFVTDPVGYAEGKDPQLTFARSSAVWPEASLEQLSDKALLIERLPALMAEFKAAVEGLGLTY